MGTVDCMRHGHELTLAQVHKFLRFSDSLGTMLYGIGEQGGELGARTTRPIYGSALANPASSEA